MKTAGLLYGSSSVQDSYDVYAGIYNDEPANGDSVSSTYAHAKGILAASESNGAFWMVHRYINSLPTIYWPYQYYLLDIIHCTHCSSNMHDRIINLLTLINNPLLTLVHCNEHATYPDTTQQYAAMARRDA